VDRAGREQLERVLQQAQPVKEEGVACSCLIGGLPPTMVRIGVKCSMRGKPIWTSVLGDGKSNKARRSFDGCSCCFNRQCWDLLCGARFRYQGLLRKSAPWNVWVRPGLACPEGPAQSPRQHCLNYSQRCVEKRARVGGWRTVRLVPGDTASRPVLRIDTMLQTMSSVQRVEQRDN
jgi:hypothetical protein